MEKFYITGGNRLTGTVTIAGAKNAAVAILPAALLADGPCVIDNLPYIDDVIVLADILTEIGANVNLGRNGRACIDGRPVRKYRAPLDMVKRMRASYYLLGVLLGKFGKAEIPLPGGCEIGARPIDQHIKGFEALGAKVEIEHGIIKAQADKLVGNEIYLDVVSVGATINIMLAAVKAEGATTIVNAAKEPHVVDVANFLNSMGADIRGAGTNVIKIRGVKKLRGGFYSIIPDQIEAGTYMAAVAATGGEVLIRNVIPKHLDCISSKMREMGVEIEDYADSVLVRRTGPLMRTNVKTMPYPGFPTDMQPQISTVLCLAEGTSVVTEGVWDNRFKYVDELMRMGGRIHVSGRTAVIEGVERLTGACVKATDLRAGAALVIAGLSAVGRTEVEGVHYIERGYENFVGKLKALGADIDSITVPDDGMAEREAV